MTTLKELGNSVRQRRTDMALTQAPLARLSGLSLVTEERVAACDEPTDRRAGQLVSETQDGRNSPTNSPEEPKIHDVGSVGAQPC